MGLKTGMYYLRTQAASAPIQFTVDQEALKVEDQAVARPSIAKKRGSSGTPSAVPRPMMDAKSPNGAPALNGINGRTNGTNGFNGHASVGASPSKVKKETSGPMSVPPFKADQEEGDSPRLLTAENPNVKAAEPIALPEAAKQEEDTDEGDREGDIYADAVLQCSIENKDACIMCSG